MTTFTGDQVSVFAMITLKSALSLYAKTGMKANRAYTPTAMMRTVSRMTGRTFKARDYARAIVALEEAIEAARQRD